MDTQGPHLAAASSSSCLHTLGLLCCEHIPAQRVTERGAGMEVIPGAVLRLGRVVPRRSIPPPLGLDSAWFSSAQPAPSPEAAQSYWTGGVSHPSMAAPRNRLSLPYTKLCLRVCSERVGNGHTEKRQRQKNPRKINYRQYLIDTVSGVGPVIQMACRGGRKALALRVAPYFHCQALSEPAVVPTEGLQGHFCSCCVARSLIIVGPCCHPHATALC